MINEERVILMTKLASYERGRGKKNVTISNFFRSDYIGFQLLKSVIYATMATGIVVGVYLFYHFEDLMQDVYELDLIEIGKDVLKYYLILIAVYCGISYAVYSYRYHKARKSLRNYYQNLRKLTQMYDS
ncbi:MAG: hypothetical protein FWG91_07660 [Lachnospiraceae bacterium]|nr:hypothetical protein [Lachnospiraceae bacterium]